jgi:hypothetical protein
MKEVIASQRLRVKNFDKILKMGGGVGERVGRHGELFPDNIRCIMAGPSGAGKTNVMINMLFDRNGLRFSNLYVFSKTLHQDKYEFLKSVMDNLSPEITYHESASFENVLPPEELPPHSIVIFDDMVCEDQEVIRRYFTMGRHNNVDVFYLTQTYSRVPKQLIRDNTSFLILFFQDELNLRHVYRDHVGGDMSFDQFKDICRNVWTFPHSFLIIDKQRGKNEGRYRNGFHKFIVNIN